MATLASAPTGASAAARGDLYRLVWRWHFYAGLLSLPFIVILSLSGMTYLFKPQIDAFEERGFRDLPAAGAPATPDTQLGAALAGRPGATLVSYRLPQDADDAAIVTVKTADGRELQVFVAPTAKPNALPAVAGVLDKETRIISIAGRIHGELLVPPYGGYLVELAGAWAFVLILTGLYLWFPRTREGVRGVLLPRRSPSGRVRWRDLHAVTGLWIGGFALVLLASGLPWTTVWGPAFKSVRAEFGWTDRKAQDWRSGPRGGDHAEHGMAGMPAGMEHWEHAAFPLTQVVKLARAADFAPPVLVTPPDVRMQWKIASQTQNRPLGASMTVDAMSGRILTRERFADKHILDRIIGTGVAWHEGALFGWVNQAIGVLTGLALMLMSVSAGVMWWKRRPERGWGAPAAPPAARHPGFVALIALAGLLMPMLGASLLAALAIDLARSALVRPIRSA